MNDSCSKKPSDCNDISLGLSSKLLRNRVICGVLIVFKLRWHHFVSLNGRVVVKEWLEIEGKVQYFSDKIGKFFGHL